MRLRIVLPKVNPEAIAVPTERVYAGCGGRTFHLRQEVTKALRDTVYHEVQAQCHVSCYEVQSGVPTFFTPKIPAKNAPNTVKKWEYGHVYAEGRLKESASSPN